MRPRWTSAWIAWLLASCAACAAAQARAQTPALELDWRAPAACPDASELRRLVTARLKPGAHMRLSATASIEVRPEGFRLQLRTEHGERNLIDRDCHALAETAALILALLIDPQAANEPALTLPVAAAQPRTLWVVVRPELLGDLGTLQAAGIGPSLGLGVRWLATSLELSGMYLPDQSLHAPNSATTLGLARLWAAGLSACQALLRAPELSPCLRLEYGRLLGEGRGIPNPAPVNGTWLMASAAARLAFALRPQLLLSLELSVGLPLHGATFTVKEVSQIHETGSVIGRARVGVELRL